MTRRIRISFGLKSFISIWLICFCVVVTILVIHITHHPSGPSKRFGSNNETNLITAGSSIHNTLTAGNTHSFRIPLLAGKSVRFSIDKGDFAMAAALYDPTGIKLLEQPSRDFEILEISSPIQVTGTYTLELHSLERKATSSYELKLQSLNSITAADCRNSEARQAMASAESLRAKWTAISIEQAARQYDNAAQIWITAGDITNGSMATLRAGDLSFLLNRYDDALKQFQNAFTLAGTNADSVVQARALSRIARLHSYRGDNDRAQKEITKALQLNKHIESNPTMTTHSYGEVLSVLGELMYAKGNLRKALTYFRDAKNLLDGDRKGQAKVHLFEGYIAGSIGNREKAVAHISQALNLYRALNDQNGEALALIALGLSHSLKGDDTVAIDLHRSAEKICRSIGDGHGQAIALNALGQAYENLGEYPIAMHNYNNALQLFESMGSLDGESVTNCNVGRAKHLSGNLDEALIRYKRCLTLSRAVRKTRTEAQALNEIAKVYIAQGESGLTLKQYAKIEQFYQAIGDHRGQAKTLNTQGDLLVHLGQKQKGLQAYTRALSLSEGVGDQGILITTLYNLARVNLDLGFPKTALPFIRRSLVIIQDLRMNIMSPDLRVSYFSGVQKHTQLCVRILMQLDELHPGDGYAAEALLVNENGRARALFDLVTESRADLRKGSAKKLLERESDLRGMLRSQAQYRMDVSSKGDSAEIAESDNQTIELRAEYQETLVRLRKSSPGMLASDLPPPFDLKQVQIELGESNTLLLEYALGDEQSYLWVVTPNTVKSHKLPGRESIEEAALELYKLHTARQRVEGEIDGRYQIDVEAADTRLPETENRLAQMLLGPVAEQLGTKRLLVVTEGALQYVPFDALPVPPGQRAGPICYGKRNRLLETSEVVLLPSFSTLLGLRRARSHASLPTKVVAVIADPVFSPHDSRLPELSQRNALAASGNNRDESPEILTGGVRLARLAYASEEADAIASVAPWGTTLVAKGFNAKRETAMSQEVAEYQILHFATHGFLESEHPELSGIVFTMTDPSGARTNGLMSLQDIYTLDLSAELTVLSACQSALGKDIKGEGLVGLTHSFLAAGSKTVVASLWKVDDRATSFLMADFYKSMLQKGMPPSTALRWAKLRMMRDERWSAPYFWAGFIAQGEYRNRIAVENNSWIHIATIFFVLVAISTVLTVQKRIPRRLLPTQSS